jgi:predicted flap endonuclease-1-like 5' DNA nuclease
MKRIHSISVLVFVASVLGAGEARASSYPLDQVLPADETAKLAKLGMQTTDDLLAQGATAKGRKKIAKETKLATAKLLEWVRMCDLVRIKGVGPEMVKLLNAAKIDGVGKLRRQKAAALLARLEKVNAKAKITEKLPAQEQIAEWIAQAKKLKDLVK